MYYYLYNTDGNKNISLNSVNIFVDDIIKLYEELKSEKEVKGDVNDLTDENKLNVLKSLKEITKWLSDYIYENKESDEIKDIVEKLPYLY